MKKVIVGTVTAVALLVGCSTAANSFDDSTKNDVVLRGSDFIEYFKDDGSDKNYLYTKTEWDDAKGNHCVVVTGDSEKTIALACTAPKGGA